MIEIGQFSTPDNSALIMAASIGLHLKNQKSEKVLALQKRFCAQANPGGRIVFVESLILLFSLGKIYFDSNLDRIVYREDR